MPSINFHNIRSHRSGKDDAFEELTRQIILANPPKGHSRIENRGPGADGGVEILVLFPDGSCQGWQSKYFLERFGGSETGQLRESFRSALENNPRLVKYTVALPRNLSGTATGNAWTQSRHWSEFTKWALAEAKKLSREIEISLWDESHFVSKLQLSDPLHAGMRSYWFDETCLTKTWFEQLFGKSKAQLGERFSPDDHVEISLGNVFEVLRRTATLADARSKLRLLLIGTIADGSILVADDIKPINSILVSAVEKLKECVLKFDSINWVTGGPIDLHELHGKLKGVLEDKDQEELWRFCRLDQKSATTSEKEKNQINTVLRFLGNISKAPQFLDQRQIEILKNPRILLLGEAGSGKSHLLADQVGNHIEDGCPAILILGESFVTPQTPSEDILKYCDFRTTSFNDFMGSLQASALASGRPFVLAIDAINDSLNAHHWRDSLRGLMSQIDRFDQIAVVVSCRSTYESHCVPNPLVGFSRIVHRGFAEDAAKAVKSYLDRHGIDRPSAPFLNPEFSNPLFLSTCVRALKAKGLNSFPTGLDGLSSVLSYWLGAIEQNLRRKNYSRIIFDSGVIGKALEKYAEELAINQTESLPYLKSEQIFESFTANTVLSSVKDKFIEQLIDEGVLRKMPTADGLDEAVAFTFQRFSDHFIARAILSLNHTPELLAAALKRSGDYHYLVASHAWRHKGILLALLSQVPEKFGLELPFLEEDLTDHIVIQIEDFIESLYWRNPEKITENTVKILERQFSRKFISNEEWFDLLVRHSNVPGSLLNAHYLFKFLEPMTIANRDAMWSYYLVGQLDLDQAVSVLVDWAWTAPKTNVEPERLKLVATVLSLMLSTPDRGVRDQATKALSAVFMAAPEIIASTIKRFAKYNDPYVRERILAAAASAIFFTRGSELAIGQAAFEAFEMVFNKLEVEHHAFIRRYANLIIETSSLRNCLPPEIDLLRCRPPYRSVVIDTWPDINEIRSLKADGISIISSTVGYVSKKEDSHPDLAGDFGRYTMAAIDNHFSRDRRMEHPPWTLATQKKEFWHKVEKLGPGIINLIEDLMQADKALQDHRSLNVRIEIVFVGSNGKRNPPKNKKKEAPDKVEIALVKTFKNVEKILLRSITPDLVSEYHALNPILRYGDEKVPVFDIRKARRWVAKRAFEFGWNGETHGKLEKALNISWGRTEHRVERFGKKYQWIAYYELAGYLADYHWYLSWEDQPTVLDAIEKFENFDIDPSFLSGSSSNAIEPFDEKLPHFKITDFMGTNVEADVNWTKTQVDIPDIRTLAVSERQKGGIWWIVSASVRDKGYLEKLQSGGVFRTGQFFYELMLLKKGDENKLLAKLQSEEGNSGNLFFNNEFPSPELYGQYSFRNSLFPLVGWIDLEVLGYDVGHVAMPFSAKRGEYDSSGADEGSFYVPRTWLVQSLKLEPASPWSKLFVNADGMPVFYDQSRRGGGEGVCVVRGDILGPLLEKEGLVPVWRVFAEKDGGLAGRDFHDFDRSKNNRQAFVGLWWQENGNWIGKTIARNESR